MIAPIIIGSIVLELNQIGTICLVVSTVVSATVICLSWGLKTFVENALLRQTQEIAQGREKMLKDMEDRFVAKETELRDLEILEREIISLRGELLNVKDRLSDCRKWCRPEK